MENAMGRKVGYARVSTDEQNLDLQRDALRKAGCDDVYEEKISGKNRERPTLDFCLRSLREGDTLVVWRLDRLGRSLADLIWIVTDLQSRGVGFESLTEKVETASPAGKLIFHVFGALAEFERNLTRERTMAGLAAARARGRQGGRPAKLGEKERREIRALLSDREVSVRDVAERYGVSRATLYKAVGVVEGRRSRSVEEIEEPEGTLLNRLEEAA